MTNYKFKDMADTIKSLIFRKKRYFTIKIQYGAQNPWLKKTVLKLLTPNHNLSMKIFDVFIIDSMTLSSPGDVRLGSAATETVRQRRHLAETRPHLDAPGLLDRQRCVLLLQDRGWENLPRHRHWLGQLHQRGGFTCEVSQYTNYTSTTGLPLLYLYTSHT